MNCRKAERQIFAERDGALDNDQRAALATHVAECAACRRKRDAVEAAINVWRAQVLAVAVPDSDRAWQDLRRELRRERDPVRTRRWIAWIGAPVAAAAAVALGVFVRSDHATLATPARTHEVARAEYVEVPSRNASTVVFVDEKSGWLVVMASDSPKSY